MRSEEEKGVVLVKRTWVYSPKPVRLEKAANDALLRRVKESIASSNGLTQTVNRIAVRQGRVYLYHLVEAFIPKGVKVHFIKPLIKGKYNELPWES